MTKRISVMSPIIISILVAIVATSPIDTNGQNVTSSADTAIPILEAAFPICNNIYDSNKFQNVIVHGMNCQCEINIPPVNKRDDYKYTPGIGAHKLHTRGATFNEARKICNEEGGHLAIIDSSAEEQILYHLFNRAGPITNAFNDKQAYIGIHDLFAEGEWVTLFNDPLYTRGYSKWSTDDGWGGQPDNLGGNQNCGTIWRPGVGTGMDDVSCHLRQAFFCEIPEVRIPSIH